MSGVEVIGTITGVAQLADFSLRLGKTVLELYSTVKNNPAVTRRRCATIKDLNDILEAIKSSQGLQTQRTGQLLQNLFDKTQRLEQILADLQKPSNTCLKKVSRIWKGYTVEREIVSIFVELESDKTNLIIHIVGIDADVLRNLDSRVSDIAIAVTKLDKGLPEIKASNEEIKDLLSAVPQSGTSTLTPQQSVTLKVFGNEEERFLPTKNLSFNNIPRNQVYDFVGQEDKLTAMQRACQRPSVSWTVVVLVGMAGSGKTQLAMRFCRLQSDVYKLIFWAEASTSASLERSYAKIVIMMSHSCSTAGVSMDSKRSTAYLKQVLTGSSQPWILVLDNYDNPEEFHDIQSFIPYNEHGIVIITSRHHDTARLGESIALSGMNEHDALTLLHKRSGHDRTSKTESVANAIVRRLGYLPLGIDQAGSYIKNQRVTLDYFLDHYEKMRRSVLCHIPKSWEYCKRPSDGDREARISVFSTWEMVYCRLEATKPALASLISLVGYFCHLSIDEVLFQNFMERYASGLMDPAQSTKPSSTPVKQGHVSAVNTLRVFLDEAGAWDSTAFRNSLAELAENCLIESFETRGDSTTKFSLHPLISDWIKIRGDESSKRIQIEQACRVTACFLHSNYIKDHSHDTKAEILSHIDEFMAFEKMLRDESFKLSLGLLRPPGLVFANFYLEQGRYSSAAELYQRVIDDCTAPPEDSLEAIRNCSHSLHCLGQYQRAENICMNSLKTLDKQFEPDDLRIISIVEILANIRRSQACYQEAEILYLKVLKGRQNKLGNNHEETLSAMANIANIYRSQGRYGDAATLYQELTTILPSDQIERTPSLLWVINDHANFLQSQGQLQQAEHRYKQILTIREAKLGKHHPDTLWTLADIAGNYRTQEKYEEAELAYRRAWEGLEQRLGRDHPETLWAADGLGHVYCSQNRLEEAESLLKQVLEDRERQLGCNHHNTLKTVHGLGDVYFFQNRLERSRCFYERAISGLEGKLGCEHPKTLGVVEKLALNRKAQGELPEAEALLKRVLQGRISCLGNEHPDTVKSMELLARVCAEIKKP